jgi:RNA polymerase sigma-70 factor (ECF subfamily)
VLEARTLDEVRQREALDTLIKRYWKPVYSFLRRKGHNNDSAKDLTQSFFEEIVLGERLTGQADPDRGRFRTFLLTALENYVVSAHRAATRKKRHPRHGLLSLDGNDSHVSPPLADSMRPQELFNYVWASDLLDEALAEVEGSCVRDGKDLHWQLFHERVLKPTLESSPPPSYEHLCQRFDIATEAAASNMVVTVKRRFKVALRRCIADQLGTEEGVDEEIHDMIAILAKGCPA